MDEDNSGDICKTEAMKFLRGQSLGNSMRELLGGEWKEVATGTDFELY